MLCTRCKFTHQHCLSSWHKCREDIRWIF